MLCINFKFQVKFSSPKTNKVQHTDGQTDKTKQIYPFNFIEVWGIKMLKTSDEVLYITSHKMDKLQW